MMQDGTRQSNWLMHASSRAGGRSRRRAFTIVELLVAAAIIIMLLSLIIVAVSAATRSAQGARTIALMNSISKGLVAFKNDIGYFPPVLGSIATNPALARDLWLPPNPDAGYQAYVQEWYSHTTLADYLIGYGNHREDGWGATGLNTPHDWSSENPVAGIRHPGPSSDGVWGSINGTLAERMKINGAYGSTTSPFGIDQGKRWGPYVEVKDERLLGAIVGFNGDVPIVAFPGDVNYNPDAPKTIVDYWGSPIRYYRRAYPTGALDQSYRAVDRDGDPATTNDRYVPTLSDVFHLRPYEFKVGSDVTARLTDASGDNGTSAELESAEFALLSPGPDRLLTKGRRVDAATQYNKDNIVEVGP